MEDEMKDKAKVSRGLSDYFYKVNKKYLIELLRLSDHNYSRLVIAAIFDNIATSTNEWNASIEEIADESKVSRTTAIRVLNELVKEDFIIRKYRWLMLNPALFCYGNKEKVRRKYLKYMDEKQKIIDKKVKE